MMTEIQIISNIPENDSIVYLGDINDFNIIDLTNEQKNFVLKKFKNDKSIAEINLFNRHLYFINISDKIIKNRAEVSRKIGDKLTSFVNSEKGNSISLIQASADNEITLSFAEGMLLGNYQFLKYYKNINDKQNSLENINIISSDIEEYQIIELKNLVEAVYLTRDLANEPFSGLNSMQLVDHINKASEASGFNTTVYNKDKIEELGMGGLLAVNRGSEYPPTFSIMEWKSGKAVNCKPIILVGKGIVFDSGGYSIKPTKNSMDIMKFDMAGAAAVIGAMYVISKNKLPLHVIGVVPATDNAVDAKSYVPGDVIKMHNGLYVEVLNTDAEGRLILADALSYVQKYDPEIVIDMATLTGSAAIALGTEASVSMGTADKGIFNLLEDSGEYVYERVVQFPFWDEYKAMLKSEIADIKNIGGREAGAVTAGKFLEHFINYPWIHIDIAGPAMLPKKSSYRTSGGSGYGVRLLYDFLKKYKSQG